MSFNHTKQYRTIERVIVGTASFECRSAMRNNYLLEPLLMEIIEKLLGEHINSETFESILFMFSYNHLCYLNRYLIYVRNL